MLRHALQAVSTGFSASSHSTPSPAFHFPLSASCCCLVLPFEGGTLHAVIFPHFYGISVCAQIDHYLAFRASRWLELWRILKFFKVVFIRPVVDVHFDLEIIPAFLAGFPVA